MQPAEANVPLYGDMYQSSNPHWSIRVRKQPACENIAHKSAFVPMARWPSGLRRCTCNAIVHGWVGHGLRGFESHLCQSFHMLVSWLRVDGSETASAWNRCLMHDRLASSQGLDSQCHDICPVTFARDDHLQSVILIRL